MWENMFSRGFSETQPNTLKYFPKHFLGCNETPENIFLSKKYFHMKIFYTLKAFYIKSKHSPKCNFQKIIFYFPCFLDMLEIRLSQSFEGLEQHSSIFKNNRWNMIPENKDQVWVAKQVVGRFYSGNCDCDLWGFSSFWCGVYCYCYCYFLFYIYFCVFLCKRIRRGLKGLQFCRIPNISKLLILEWIDKISLRTIEDHILYI